MINPNTIKKGTIANIKEITITVEPTPVDISRVVITSPGDGATFNEGDNLYVKVDAIDTDGIYHIWLYINGIELEHGEGAEPYEWGAEGQDDPELQNLQVGTYTLKAKLKDNLVCHPQAS